MQCPFCNSENTRMMNFSFPKTYECLKCCRIFSKPTGFSRELE